MNYWLLVALADQVYRHSRSSSLVKMEEPPKVAGDCMLIVISSELAAAYPGVVSFLELFLDSRLLCLAASGPGSAR